MVHMGEWFCLETNTKHKLGPGGGPGALERGYSNLCIIDMSSK